MEPPDVSKNVGRPRAKRTREPDEARKRVGEWSYSRKGVVMTCSNCGGENHNVRGCFKEKLMQTLQNQEKGNTRKVVQVRPQLQNFHLHLLLLKMKEWTLIVNL
uniref:Uncharacterized protein n=1 Tax=Nicotiana tabacum TaxID=4097 RepID=A0A1S3XA27_TOBAC|nr:PREDICTED: uncharacterized protein LOC107762880 [Nicotiana tabacum]